MGGSAGLEFPRAYGVRGVTGNAGVSGLDEPLKCDVSLSVSVRYDENDSSRTYFFLKKTTNFKFFSKDTNQKKNHHLPLISRIKVSVRKE